MKPMRILLGLAAVVALFVIRNVRNQSIQQRSADLEERLKDKQGFEDQSVRLNYHLRGTYSGVQAPGNKTVMLFLNGDGGGVREIYFNDFTCTLRQTFSYRIIPSGQHSGNGSIRIQPNVPFGPPPACSGETYNQLMASLKDSGANQYPANVKGIEGFVYVGPELPEREVKKVTNTVTAQDMRYLDQVRKSFTLIDEHTKDFKFSAGPNGAIYLHNWGARDLLGHFNDSGVLIPEVMEPPTNQVVVSGTLQPSLLGVSAAKRVEITYYPGRSNKVGIRIR
ncbi:hypothetical protein [Neolewinella persica]|uniref:hypothetical protein n=1 Tax=Neolewinella persica TaxID=70998 RepID=UPI000399E492|nr:hypothetical protein [Neolewinella persica]